MFNKDMQWVANHRKNMVLKLFSYRYDIYDIT